MTTEPVTTDASATDPATAATAPLDPTTLTEAELASLTSGASTWDTQALPGRLPAIVLSDGPHGLRRQVQGGDNLGIGDSEPATCFPPATGLASTWDRDLVREVGAALGREARDLGVSVLLGPGVNIRRSPLGGRNFEYASEDPYLSGEYGVAFIEGVQSQGVAATPKHFAVNNQETDRFRVDARVDERTLREIYLPAFEAIVRRARPWALMCSYNRVNGTYASQHPWLLTEVLREEWGFDGLVMSDWGAVVDRVAALDAGLDLEMPPSHTDAQVADALADGSLPRGSAERAARALAVLESRTRAARLAVPPLQVDAAAGQEVALRAARASLVLLHNDGTLPLDARETPRLAVIGAFADTPRFQGGGSSRVVPTEVTDVLGSFADEPFEVEHAPGFRLGGTTADERGADGHQADEHLADEAVAAAERADVAVVLVGLPDGAESEGSDRRTMDLPADQIALLERLSAGPTPLVVVVSGGGVLRLGAWRESTAALVQGWLLGQAGGRATVDVLTGRAEPAGHLTETIPLAYEDTPAARYFPGRDRQVVHGEGMFVGYRHYDSAHVPVAYPFGHGLTYTTFAYDDLEITLAADLTVGVDVTVTNTGDRPGSALAQVYVRQDEDPQSPVHALRGFTRVQLAPGESRRVHVDLDERSLAAWDVHEHRWRTRPGTVTIEVGESSRDLRLTADLDHPGDGLTAPLEAMSTIAEWLADPRGAQVLAPLVQGVQASVGAAESAPEMREMFLQMPLVKLAAWGIGLSEDDVDAMVAAARS